MNETPLSYPSLPSLAFSTTPVYVPTFNNPTYTRRMVKQLRRWRLTNIVIVDNASTYKPMIELLNHLESQFKVVRLAENNGAEAITAISYNLKTLPDVFVITDPDLEFNPDMPLSFLVDLYNLTNHFRIGKAGLALDISDKDAMRQDKFLIGRESLHIWEYESRHWNLCVGSLPNGNPAYRAPIDTTFALYNKRHFSRETFLEAIRVGGAFTCKHRPWYKDVPVPREELDFYGRTQKTSFYGSAPGST
jgi:glycosyltransferase involved in cell wall biosynthesis